MEIVGRFFQDPGGSFFLFGPRGTGKSTWVLQQLEDVVRIDLLEPDIFRTYSARPERLRELVSGSRDKKVVVIDEIQKVPALLSAVHALIEQRRDLRFVMTGSSARKVKGTGVDLLAGRAVLRSMHPFMAAELGEAFSLKEALQIGLLPLVVAATDPQDVLRSYAALYLREEVQMEGLVRKIGDFSRFLEAISFSHASVLNVSNVAREGQVGRKVVESYVGILEDLLLAFRVPMFAKRAKRALSAKPKFYFFDAGVFRSLRPRGPLDRPEEIEGHALEGLVAQHLRAWIAYGGEPYDLGFWRTRSGVEVDFIVYGPGGFWAIEVKGTARLRPSDLRSLRAFREDYPQSKGLLLYRGTERLLRSDILCVPCEEFLRQLRPVRLLDAGL